MVNHQFTMHLSSTDKFLTNLHKVVEEEAVNNFHYFELHHLLGFGVVFESDFIAFSLISGYLSYSNIFHTEDENISLFL